MKHIFLLTLFTLASCQNAADQYFEKASIVEVSPVLPPEGKLFKGVCKIETAPNYEPLDGNDTFTYIADNNLCQKEVCIKEYVETTFELVNPEIVKFGCDSSISDKDYEVTLGWSADDASTVYMDGIEMGRSDAWTVFHEETITLKGGCHTLAIHAIDVHRVISGILAYLKVDGKVVWRSGDGNQFLKAFGPTTPVGDWTSLNYDQSAWKDSESCSDISPWGSKFSDMRQAGSKWIWWSANCKNLTQAYFRLSFSLMPPTVNLVHKEEMCKK